MTQICVSKLTIFALDNGLSPDRRQAIIWNNAGILLIRPLGTNFSEILIKIHTFSFKKVHLKMLSGKWRPFCLGFNVLRNLMMHQAGLVSIINMFWNPIATQLFDTSIHYHGYNTLNTKKLVSVKYLAKSTQPIKSFPQQNTVTECIKQVFVWSLENFTNKLRENGIQPIKCQLGYGKWLFLDLIIKNDFFNHFHMQVIHQSQPQFNLCREVFSQNMSLFIFTSPLPTSNFPKCFCDGSWYKWLVQLKYSRIQ